MSNSKKSNFKLKRCLKLKQKVIYFTRLDDEKYIGEKKFKEGAIL